MFANTENIPEKDQLIKLYKSYEHFDQVCWLTSHNSYAYDDPSFLKKGIHPNQELDIKNQLEYGVKSFMIDLYYDDDNESIILAHSMNEDGVFATRFYKQKLSSPRKLYKKL